MTAMAQGLLSDVGLACRRNRGGVTSFFRAGMSSSVCTPLMSWVCVLLVVSRSFGFCDLRLNEAKVLQPCADEAKILKPCVHDRGCTPRRHRTSVLVGAFCLGGWAHPGRVWVQGRTPPCSPHCTWINPQAESVDYPMALAWAGPSHAHARAASRPPGPMFRGLGREAFCGLGRPRSQSRWRPPLRPRRSSVSRGT